MTETRITSKTGGQKGRKEARLGGADALALQELALVYGMGEEKYARYNYLKGYAWSLSVDALYRHLLAFLAGEDRDPESGLLHTAHVAWHALALTSFQKRRIGEDDRPPGENVAIKPEYPLTDPRNPKYEIYTTLLRTMAQLGLPPYPDHADMSVDERRDEEPWLKCDHGVSMHAFCGPCSKWYSRAISRIAYRDTN